MLGKPAQMAVTTTPEMLPAAPHALLAARTPLAPRNDASLDDDESERHRLAAAARDPRGAAPPPPPPPDVECQCCYDMCP